MTGLTVWLQGKKTYVSAGALVLLGVVLIWGGDTSLGMIAVMQGFGLVGLGAKAERHQAEILALIQTSGAMVARDIHINVQPPRLPSGADLDAVAEELRVKAATAGVSR